MKKLIDNIEKRKEILLSLDQIFNFSADEFKIWQHKQLFSSVRMTYENSVYYKSKYGDLGFDVSKISSFEEFEKLPYIYRDDLKKNYPFGMRIAPMNKIVRYGESTGTTGTPIAAYYTERDWIENNYTVSYYLSKILNENDIVAVAAPYELAFVAQDLDRALEALNCTVIAIGALTKICPPERMIKIFKTVGVTALICAATRCLLISDVAEEMGYNLKKDFKISKVFSVGECMTDAKKALLEERWGAELFSMYGMTETNTLGMYCQEKNMHLVENRNYFEIIDSETGKINKQSDKGELVVTSLNTAGLPLMRYRTGDIIKINNNSCKCGLPFRTMQHLGRAEDVILLKNKKVPIMELEDQILSASHALYYTLENKPEYLEIGLTIERDRLDSVGKALGDIFLNKYNTDVKVIITSKERVQEIIRENLKPNIQSILINNKK